MSFSLTAEIPIGPEHPLVVFAGPCQIEGLDHALKSAETLARIFGRLKERYHVHFLYKSSYDKANRTSLDGARGIGIEEGLTILQTVKEQFGLPIITDVHSPSEAQAAAEVVDVLQTPAFLCRQTDLLIAAGKTMKPINVKKGQFLAPEDMRYVAEKIASTGNSKIMLCERGASFGYRDLIVDPRSLAILNTLGYPVVFDATHSVQSLGGQNGRSGGSRRFIPPLTRAAMAIGVSALFVECHQNPEQAPSDGQSMIPIDALEELLREALEFHALRKSLSNSHQV